VNGELETRRRRKLVDGDRRDRRPSLSSAAGLIRRPARPRTAAPGGRSYRGSDDLSQLPVPRGLQANQVDATPGRASPVRAAIPLERMRPRTLHAVDQRPNHTPRHVMHREPHGPRSRQRVFDDGMPAERVRAVAERGARGRGWAMCAGRTSSVPSGARSPVDRPVPERAAPDHRPGRVPGLSATCRDRVPSPCRWSETDGKRAAAPRRRASGGSGRRLSARPRLQQRHRRQDALFSSSAMGVLASPRTGGCGPGAWLPAAGDTAACRRHSRRSRRVPPRS
jgi:hypothetical protein